MHGKGAEFEPWPCTFFFTLHAVLLYLLIIVKREISFQLTRHTPTAGHERAPG